MICNFCEIDDIQHCVLVICNFLRNWCKERSDGIARLRASIQGYALIWSAQRFEIYSSRIVARRRLRKSTARLAPCFVSHRSKKYCRNVSFSAVFFYPLRKQWHIIAVRRISSALTSISRQSEYIISRRLYTLSQWCKERSDGIASLRASIQNRVLMIYRNKLLMIYNGKPLIF